NKASQTLCEEWATKEKVDLSVDYITSMGNKNLLTIAAEAQARSGHDIFAFPSWQPADHANRLEPVDDVMTELIKQNGAVNPTVEYLAKSTGRWVAVPACVGSQIKGPCSRIDLMKRLAGIDVQAMYPAGSPPKAEEWTLDAMLKAAEACHKGGHPFGIGLGVTEDSVDPAGALRTVHTLLLGHLELRQEQVGGQEPAGPSLATIGDREDGGSERRLRPARIREADDVESLGGGGAAQGHALPLPQSAQPPDPVGRRATR